MENFIQHVVIESINKFSFEKNEHDALAVYHIEDSFEQMKSWIHFSKFLYVRDFVHEMENYPSNVSRSFIVAKSLAKNNITKVWEIFFKL